MANYSAIDNISGEEMKRSKENVQNFAGKRILKLEIFVLLCRQY